jgi:hypothetical protein
VIIVLNALPSLIAWGIPVNFLKNITQEFIALYEINDKVKNASLFYNVKDCLFNGQKQFLEIFEKNKKLRDDILLHPRDGVSNASALGSNFGPCAVICYNHRALDFLDKEVVSFWIKHEISHIYSSDPVQSGGLAVISSTVSAYALSYLRPCLPWWGSLFLSIFPYYIGWGSKYAYGYICESRADDFACKHATPQELQAIEKYIEGIIEVNQERHKKYPNFYTKDGNFRLEKESIRANTHPSWTDRLAKVRQVMKKRGITSQIISNEKIEKIKQYEKTYNPFKLNGIIQD